MFDKHADLIFSLSWFTVITVLVSLSLEICPASKLSIHLFLLPYAVCLAEKKQTSIS